MTSLLPWALFPFSSYPTFATLALFSYFCPLSHLFASKYRSSSVVACHSSRDPILKLLWSSYHSSQVYTISPEPSGSPSHTLPMTAIIILTYAIII
jgi:hypothetical protein